MKYAPEQIAIIVSFVNDFATWVNTQIDKEMSNAAEIAFAVTPEYRAKVEGKTAAYSQCVHHLADVAKQLVTDNFGDALK
jgi:hypothetical protein